MSETQSHADQRSGVVIWISHRGDERCAMCGAEIGNGAFVQVRRDTGVRCIQCSGFSGLVFLPSGDAALTRRAVRHSSLSAVVVRYSRARKRPERQGVLVEGTALEAARQECLADEAHRRSTRERRRVRDQVADRQYVMEFARAILELFPATPSADAQTIAQHACEKYSGRVGRSRAAKEFEPQAITLAVRAHVRHRHTNYDDLLAQGAEPAEARSTVAPRVEAVLNRWRRERDPATRS